MPTKRKGSRTMTITHKGETITVREGHTGTLEFRFDNRGAVTTPLARSFPAACREALTHLLRHAGELKGDYER